MQALGNIRGRMLFLGLGTGLGAALVWSKNLLPLELGDFCLTAITAKLKAGWA